MFARSFNRSLISLSKRNFSQKVTIQQALAMPKNFSDMSNELLHSISLNSQEAREELVIREIMKKDNVDWAVANKKFQEIINCNRSDLFLATLPYKIGISVAMVSAFASIPLIFHEQSVMLFNELYVTADVPEPEDLETPLEIGIFSWNWMEPILGTTSFFLLCFQYARAQMSNLSVKPYSGWYKEHRAKRVIRTFPQYDPVILTNFSEGDPLHGNADPSAHH